DPPQQLPGTSVRVFVLGPPHDEKMIKTINPSKQGPAPYGILSDMFLDKVAAALTEDPKDGIFDKSFQIPLAAAQQMSFFQNYYWGEDHDSAEKDQSWRRIDGSWLDGSSAMALALDSVTNNTSLVLAFELEGGDVLLFAGDAQAGSWLSWQD